MARGGFANGNAYFSIPADGGREFAERRLRCEHGASQVSQRRLVDEPGPWPPPPEAAADDHVRTT